MNKKFLTIAMLIALSITSCKENVKQENSETTKPESEVVTTTAVNDKSENSSSWEGTYKGTTPCADCDGIEETMTINKDLTFVLETVYLGKPKENKFTERGTFTWNKEGDKITTITNDKKETKSYLVGDQKLTILNADGKVNTDSKMAEMYILKQVAKK